MATPDNEGGTEHTAELIGGATCSLHVFRSTGLLGGTTLRVEATADTAANVAHLFDLGTRYLQQTPGTSARAVAAGPTPTTLTTVLSDPEPR